MITSRSKKVSVVVPNYNYARYIGRRIDSILRQTYPIYELIILDDCSTDGSVKEILQALKKHNLNLEKYKTPNNRGDVIYNAENKKLKVKLVVSEKNSGKAIAAWRKGVELAGGDYVWIAEADDLSKRKFLEEAMKGFEKPGVVMSYTESMVINGRGIVIAPNFRWSRDKERTGHYKRSYVKDGKDEIREIMAVRCTIPNVSGVVLKNDKDLLKYLDESLKFAQVGDWYFYAKVLEGGKISYNRKALNKFRIHGGSVTEGMKKTAEHYEEIEEMHDYFKKRYNLNDEVLRRMQNEAQRVKERMAK